MAARGRVREHPGPTEPSHNVPIADRYGLLHGVWFLLPYMAWESLDAARDFRADVKILVGESGVTDEMLADWAQRFPAPKPRAGGRGKKA